MSSIPDSIQRETHWVKREGQPRLHLTRWKPSDSRGVILRLHGIESHTCWYEETSHALASAGYTVVFQDRRGAGKSEGERGDVESHRTWLHDLRATINDVRWREGVDSVHLMANCWGARLALALATEKPRGVRSLVLMAPALAMRQTFSASEKLHIAADALLRLNPKRQRPHPVWSARLFTRDEERIAMIESDPLALRECTARFFAATQRMTLNLPRRLSKVALPTLALFGEADRVVDVPQTQATLRKMAPEHLAIKTYPNQCHMLEFEPAREQVIADTLEWLSKW